MSKVRIVPEAIANYLTDAPEKHSFRTHLITANACARTECQYKCSTTGSSVRKQITPHVIRPLSPHDVRKLNEKERLIIGQIRGELLIYILILESE